MAIPTKREYKVAKELVEMLKEEPKLSDRKINIRNSFRTEGMDSEDIVGTVCYFMRRHELKVHRYDLADCGTIYDFARLFTPHMPETYFNN